MQSANWSSLPKDVRALIMMHRGWMCLGPYKGIPKMVLSGTMRINFPYAMWTANLLSVKIFWAIGKECVRVVNHTYKRQKSRQE